MIVSNLLAKAFNHVVKQPISKFLYGGMMLKATYYGNRPSAIEGENEYDHMRNGK